MSNVIQLREPKAANEAARVLSELSELEAGGKMDGFMYFSSTEDGANNFGLSGAYSDRLQFALYSLVKATNNVMERILDAGTAGHTGVSPIKAALEPLRQMPRQLKETDFGELS